MLLAQQRDQAQLFTSWDGRIGWDKQRLVRAHVASAAGSPPARSTLRRPPRRIVSRRSAAHFRLAPTTVVANHTLRPQTCPFHGHMDQEPPNHVTSEAQVDDLPQPGGGDARTPTGVPAGPSGVLLRLRPARHSALHD